MFPRMRNYFIARIHHRELEHIKRLAESDARPSVN
jgi:hypothetical protein